jgi:hypothetical protein
MIGRPPRKRAIETVNTGLPWAKFMVPSSGSISQQYSGGRETDGRGAGGRGAHGRETDGRETDGRRAGGPGANWREALFPGLFAFSCSGEMFPDSSPWIAWLGKAIWMRRMMAFSASLSATVTRSTSPFFTTDSIFPKCFRRMAEAASAHWNMMVFIPTEFGILSPLMSIARLALSGLFHTRKTMQLLICTNHEALGAPQPQPNETLDTEEERTELTTEYTEHTERELFRVFGVFRGKKQRPLFMIPGDLWNHEGQWQVLFANRRRSW